MNHLPVNQEAGVELIRGGRTLSARSARAEQLAAVEQLVSKLGGRFTVEHWRNGERINEYQFDNGIVNEGKNLLLNVMFSGTSAITTWYLGLIDDAGFSALASDDIYDDINQAGNGWDEFAAYTDPANADDAGTRPAWTEGGASAQSITNAATVNFDITGTGEVKGVFLAGGANAQTKSDHTASGNFLWATALFSGGDVPVINGDQLRVTYSVSA